MSDRLTDMAEQIAQALNYIQPTETDVPELEERRKAIRRSLMDTRALLRAASAETVGTEWGFIQHASEHNADLHAARLAIAGLKAERDAKQRAIDEAFAVLDAGHGMLACREAAHILRPHATKATEANSSATVTGSPHAPADDTRELVARLALAVRNDAVERCNPELEAACDAIIADARRGGGA